MLRAKTLQTIRIEWEQNTYTLQADGEKDRQTDAFGFILVHPIHPKPRHPLRSHSGYYYISDILFQIIYSRKNIYKTYTSITQRGSLFNGLLAILPFMLIILKINKNIFIKRNQRGCPLLDTKNIYTLIIYL